MDRHEQSILLRFPNITSGEIETIKLELRGKITIILGDSGVGKTYMFDSFRGAQANSEGIETNIDLQNIRIITEERDYSGNKGLMEIIKRNRGKLFMIDEADTRLGKSTQDSKEDADIKKEIRHYIEKDLDSNYILMARSTNTESYGTTPANIATVEFKDGTFSLNYAYDIGGW